MATLYDVAHYCSWNGYTEDMRSYLGVDTAAWTNKEFWFPYGANILYGPKKKTRIQRICEEMESSYDPKNYYNYCMTRSYDPVARVQELLADGAKPDIKDAEGWSALLVCCRNGFEGHLEIVKLLLDAGADINQNDHVFTPLHFAASNGNMIIMRELLRRGALHLPTNNGATPIGFAAKSGHLEIVKELIKAGAIVDDSVFKRVIFGGQVAVLKYLISLGYPIPADSVYNAVDYNKPHIIRSLVKAGADMNFGFPVHKAIASEAYDCLYELSTANLNLPNHNNETPLKYAIFLGDPKAVMYLSNKANLNYMTDGQTLLHSAMFLCTQFPQKDDKARACLKAIIDAGPNFNLVNRWGETPVQYAQGEGMSDIVMMLKRGELKQRFSVKIEGAKPSKPKHAAHRSSAK